MDFKEIQKKWVEKWDYTAVPDDREKKMCTFPYPYMNGALHIGHSFTATRVDAYARYQRAKGKNVLFPFAFHATGEPVVGAAKRIAAKDEAIWKNFRNEGLSDKQIKEFEDPQKIAAYYRIKATEQAKELGYSVDWTRQFITIEPLYNKFIEWQYNTLKSKGFVVQGSHPVIYCPNCESPTGDHDRLKGEGATIEEFTLLKFPFEGKFIIAATLRPETVFGQTNMWVHPDVEYAVIKVNDEEWIVSEECFKKLETQKDNVKKVGSIKGKEMLGKTCVAPGAEREIIILPGPFVDPKVGTGLVTSVPSHAVWDYQALMDLKNNPEMNKKYDLDSVNLISIIKVDGYGEHPAKEFCEKNNVQSQEDTELLDKGKKEIYKLEFHKGVLKDNCGEFAGKKIVDAKELVKQKLISENKADVMQEISEDVICRCGTSCIIKKIEGQWFLKYSDENWKKLTHKALDQCKVYPDDYRSALDNTIDWLHDKACTRKSGMGTKLPWDKDWIVETLSDSTIYNALYTFMHLLRAYDGEVNDALFDYVFLGKGEGNEKLSAMRKEFLYWYPVDFRNSGKDLVNNHLTFYLFHHTAIFPEEKWPRGIGVNGFVTAAGEKMSKSKGNVVNLTSVLNKYGSDAVRMNVLYSAEGTQDPAWHEETAKKTLDSLSNFLGLAEEVGKERSKELKSIDYWLIKKVSDRQKSIEDAYEEVQLRTAIRLSFYENMNDVSWYLYRTKERNDPAKNWVMAWALGKISQFIEPISPFVAHEVHEKLFGKEMSFWEEPEQVEEKYEVAEGLVKKVLDDYRNILNIVKTKPKKLFVYTAADWKKKAVCEIVKAEDFSGAMKSMVPFCKPNPSFAKEVFNKKQEYCKELVDENKVLSEAIEFIAKETGCEVKVFNEEEPGDDPGKKACKAMPFKPALYVE